MDALDALAGDRDCQQPGRQWLGKKPPFHRDTQTHTHTHTILTHAPFQLVPNNDYKL